jgi:hypothetical protein
MWLFVRQLAQNKIDQNIKIEKAAEGNATMISVDGDTVISRKTKACREWSYAGKWKVVRLPGRSAWNRIQGRPTQPQHFAPMVFS